VLFSDIRDFTALSEQLTPQQNFDFLNSYLSQVTPIIRANHGFIDKYMGDGIMALFARASADALATAVEMQKKMVLYNNGRKAAGYVPIRIGIGVHRGDLILGTIGEEQRIQTTVIADAVNVASRIEGLTKTLACSILVSGAVVDTLADGSLFKLRHLGAVKAKGKTQSVEIYECFDNDPPELIAHKEKTAATFASGMAEFRNGMLISAGRIFSRLSEQNRDDAPAAYYRDACSRAIVRDRKLGPWDGSEIVEVK
jgi:two-component system, sensor histidine kinase ChiS